MMLQKPITIFSCCLWLLMAISSSAQSPPGGTPVVDTAGRALRRGVEYIIKPAITDVAGDLTLQSRNGTSCPLFVGQEPLLSGRRGIPVTFTPFFQGESIIREGRDLKVVFQAATLCLQPTQWKVGEEEAVTRRRLVAAGIDDTAAGFFRIDKNSGVYNLGWCPSDVPIRGRPRCGSAGIVIEKGVRLLALDGPAFPFEFERAPNTKP